MAILSELRDTYWGADFAYKMFERAQTKLAEALEIRMQTNQDPSLRQYTPKIFAAPMPEATTFPGMGAVDQSSSDYPPVDDILAAPFYLSDSQNSFWWSAPGLL